MIRSFGATANWNNPGATNVKTFTLAVQAGDIVLAYGATDDNPNSLAISNDGTSFGWAPVEIVNVPSNTRPHTWKGVADSTRTVTITLTCSSGNEAFGGGAIAFDPALVDSISASSQLTGSGAPSWPLTTTAADSWIFQFVSDWNAASGASRAWRAVNGITPRACTANTSSGSPTLASVAPTTGWANGMPVFGPGIPPGTTIASGAGTATMTMSANATATATGVAIGQERVYSQVSGQYTVYAAVVPGAGVAGSKTLGMSAPAGLAWAAIGVEIKKKAATPPPANTVAPAITGHTAGEATIGTVLACGDGTWTGSPSIAKQWRTVAGGPIAGATAGSYTLNAGDLSVGAEVFCRVTATNAGGSVSADSARVTVIAPPSGPSVALFDAGGDGVITFDAPPGKIASPAGAFTVACIIRKGDLTYTNLVTVETVNGHALSIVLDEGGHGVETLDASMFPMATGGFPPAGEWCKLIVRMVDEGDGAYRPHVTVWDIERAEYVIDSFSAPMDDVPADQVSSSWDDAALVRVTVNPIASGLLLLGLYQTLSDTEVDALVASDSLAVWATTGTPVFLHRYAAEPIVDLLGSRLDQATLADVTFGASGPDSWIDDFEPVDPVDPDPLAPDRIVMTASGPLAIKVRVMTASGLMPPLEA